MKDTIVRNNRTLPDYICPACGLLFRPPRKDSKYCSNKCVLYVGRRKRRKSQGETWWKNSKGYIEGYVWVDGNRRRIYQHRYYMELQIGRPLNYDEVVHHINGIKNDNRLINLQVMSLEHHSIETNRDRKMQSRV